MTGPEALEEGFALLREARLPGGGYHPAADVMIAEAQAHFAAAQVIATALRTPEGFPADYAAWRDAAAPARDDRKQVAA